MEVFNELFNTARTNANLPKLNTIEMKKIIKMMQDTTNELFPDQQVTSLPELTKLLNTNYLQFVNKMYLQGNWEGYKWTSRQLLESVTDILEKQAKVGKYAPKPWEIQYPWKKDDNQPIPPKWESEILGNNQQEE